MKTQKPKQLKPDPGDFLKLTDGKISDEGKNSAAWKVVYSLFQTAQKLYSTLDFMTSERLSVFVESETYLTPRQEYDLVALTAHYVANLDTNTAADVVRDDAALTDGDRQLLLSAIELFKSSTTATYMALGNPRWVDPVP